MKIDFKRLKMYSDITRSEESALVMDVRKQFADIIYKNGSGIECLDLALKIYRSDGEEEYSEQEYAIMKQVASMCSPMFIDAINNCSRLQ